MKGVRMSVIIGMAFDRKQFENRIWEKMAGAASEYYKARIGSLLGWPESIYVGKWGREVDRLLFQELSIFYHLSETTFKNREKVLEKVKKQVMQKEEGFLKAAITSLNRIAVEKPKLNTKLSNKKLEQIDIMLDFLKEVDKAVETKLDGPIKVGSH